MQRASGLSIRVQLFILVAVIALPLTGLLIYSVYANAREAIADAKAAARTLAVLTASDTSRTLKTNIDALNLIGERPLVRAMDASRCDPALGDLRPLFPAAIDLGTVNLSGDLVCSAMRPPGASRPSLAGTPWFRQAVAEDRAVVGNPVLGPITGRWGSVLAQPLHDEHGKLNGLLVLPLDLVVYVPNISAAPLIPRTTVGIVTGDGILVWRNVEPEKWIGKNVGDKDAIRQLLATGSGEFEARTSDSLWRYYAAEKIKGADWYAFVGVPADTIYAAARASAIRNGAIGLASLLAVIGFALLLSRRIERPIQTLAATARAIREGEGERRAEPSGAREIAALAGEFNLMLDHAKEFERRLSGVFNNVSLVTATFDIEGNLTFANQKLFDMTGWTREEVIGRNWFRIFRPPEQRDEQLARYVNNVGTGNIEPHYEGDLVARDGRRYLIEWNRTVMRDLNGTIVGVAALGLDITEARRAERLVREANATLAESLAQLQTSLKQLRDITDNLPVAITYTDRDRILRFANRTMALWLARPVEEILGRRFAELVEVGNSAGIEASVQQVLQGHAARLERTAPYPDGSTRCLDTTYLPDFGAAGQVRGYYALAIDISATKAVEEQLRQSQKLDAVGKLTGGVAHDFNNLLAVISGNLELVAEALQGREDLQGRIRAALRASERGATLTRSLLAFSRQQPLSPSVVDLNGLVREMADLVRRTMPGNIALEIVGGAGLWSCEVDPGQLQNAILNLVLNARDAMPKGGRLTIEAANARLDDEYAAAHAEVKPGQYVMLAVSDSGEGMPPDVVEHAFEPFFTTKEVGKGTGLGLSMVYGFTKQSNGHVNIYSEVGHGTTVKLYLPRALRVSDAAEESAVPAYGGGRGETILVVEDDADVRTLIFALLRSLGYTVLDAASSEQALRLLQTAKPEVALLLTDVMLADGVNGRELAEAAVRLCPHLKVLYMSGYTENAILHHGRLDPGVQLLQKPFRREDLARKVGRMLDKALPS